MPKRLKLIVYEIVFWAIISSRLFDGFKGNNFIHLENTLTQ